MLDRRFFNEFSLSRFDVSFLVCSFANFCLPVILGEEVKNEILECNLLLPPASGVVSDCVVNARPQKAGETFVYDLRITNHTDKTIKVLNAKPKSSYANFEIPRCSIVHTCAFKLSINPTPSVV